MPGMIGQACEYVSQYYGVPACIGRRVIAYGKPGVIVKDCGHHIGIALDEDPKRRVGHYHPLDGIEYGEIAENLPKPPKRTNWDRYHDEEWNCSFREYLEINQPQFQTRIEDKLVRMVRHYRGTFHSNYPSREYLAIYQPDRDVEVAGEWVRTRREAKASYKAALRRAKQQ